MYDVCEQHVTLPRTIKGGEANLECRRWLIIVRGIDVTGMNVAVADAGDMRLVDRTAGRRYIWPSSTVL